MEVEKKDGTISWHKNFVRAIERLLGQDHVTVIVRDESQKGRYEFYLPIEGITIQDFLTMHLRNHKNQIKKLSEVRT